MTPPLSRLAAPLGLGLAALLGPLQSVIWNGPTAPSWARAVARVIQPSLSFEIAAAALPEPPAVYFSHGRLFVLVYLLLAVGVVGASASLSRWTLRALLLSLAVATVADLLAFALTVEAFVRPRGAAVPGVEAVP